MKKSKFLNLYHLVLEQLSDEDFLAVKSQAKKESEKFVKKLTQNEVLNDVLNLTSQEDFQNFLNDIYRTIITGSKGKFIGDIRQLSNSLNVEDDKLKLSKLTEKSQKYKEFKKENPDASLEDYKIKLIRDNISKLDDIARLYSVEFRQLMRIYENRNELGLSLQELKGRNIIKTIYERYKEYDLSEEFITRLFNFDNIKKNGANIGKGEFLICLFIKNSEWPVDNCDVAIDGNKYEIKGSEAKIGETESPVNIFNKMIVRIKSDYDQNVKRKDQIDLTKYNFFKGKITPEFRDAFNFIRGDRSSNPGDIFSGGEGGCGIIWLIRKMYNYENLNSQNERDEIDQMILDYLNEFYSNNIIGYSGSDMFTLADIQSNDYNVLRDKFCLKILEYYKNSLGFKGIIYIGEDHILHLFDGSANNIFKKMKPYMQINYPSFTSLEKQQFHNRIIMAK